jgi:3-hydroxyacyl-CoA dehydrogenase/enoyl-CoA hydratase/3-hydroxybutyryl-CoA epimerase
LAELFPRKAQQPNAEELRRRFLYIQALESARCVEEEVITDPADADLGAILGIGYPSWTGGPLSLIDTLGIQPFVEACDLLAVAHGPSPSFLVIFGASNFAK